GDESQLRVVLMEANTCALQELRALKRQYPRALTPQVEIQDGKILMTKAAPQPKSVVLQGGGGKGFGLPPLLDEMDKAGMFADVDVMVGTSIGALNASCLACGGLEDERKILDISAFRQGYDYKKTFQKQYPEVSFRHPGETSFLQDVSNS